MDKWEVEDAVKLLQSSVPNGQIPHQNIVLNLLQQLANLGETECLLDLQSFLLNEKLCSNDSFFKCLQEAYYNSGRVEEGMHVLRILYHKTRIYKDVDVFFTLLAVMILKHFPEKINLIENFAKDCQEMGDDIPTAAIWKSCVITGEFEKAEDLMLTYECIHPHFGMMVSDILTRKNKVDMDRQLVLGRLLNFPSVHLKSRLKAALYLAYSSELCEYRVYEFLLETSLYSIL